MRSALFLLFLVFAYLVIAFSDAHVLKERQVSSKAGAEDLAAAADDDRDSANGSAGKKFGGGGTNRGFVTSAGSGANTGLGAKVSFGGNPREAGGEKVDPGTGAGGAGFGFHFNGKDGTISGSRKEHTHFL